MSKRVVLMLDVEDHPITKIVETDFSSTELQEAADSIFEELSQSEDGWNEDKVLEELVKRNYIKVISDAEIYEILLP